MQRDLILLFINRSRKRTVMLETAPSNVSKFIDGSRESSGHNVHNLGDPDLHQLLIFILHHCSIFIICIKNELPNVLDSYLIQKWLCPVLTFYIVKHVFNVFLSILLYKK